MEIYVWFPLSQRNAEDLLWQIKASTSVMRRFGTGGPLFEIATSPTGKLTKKTACNTAS